MSTFDPILLPFVRRALPAVLASDICSVQPMSTHTGLVFGLVAAGWDGYDVMTKEQFTTVFQQGRIAAERGWERRSPYIKCAAEAVWYEGYDSSAFIPFG